MKKLIRNSLLFMAMVTIVLMILYGSGIISTATANPDTTDAKWWDKFGKPQYGGILVNREGELTGQSFDPINPFGAWYTVYWMESLFQPDWTVDRAEWLFNVAFTPLEYMTGGLARSWEQTDPLTYTVHLRQGICWQNKPPVNGREFTADDVQYSYDRMLGSGNGFTEPNMFWAGAIANVQKVVATDKYTVQFKLKAPGAMTIFQITEGNVMRAFPIVAREWVEQGDTQNWKNAVGTGPFMLTDFVDGTSYTLSRNPDYWGYDERYPENRLPYVDTFKLISIPDMATSLAAMRSGKLDLIVQTRAGMTWQQGSSLAKTNPEIKQVYFPVAGYSLDMRCDKEPFNDIKVRRALQLALDLKTIAKNYFGGVVEAIPCGVTSWQYEGWVLPYDKWPAELRQEYSYNPDKAKNLLKEAGYPNGFKTNCVASAGDDMQLLQIIKAMLKDVNVDMEIKTVDPAAFMAGGDLSDQMALMNGTAMPFGPDWCIRMLESTNTRDNRTHNNDTKYDAMIRAFDAAPTVDEAMKVSIEADQYLLRQHWSLQTFRIASVFAWQPYVKGYTGELIIGSPWVQHVPARIWLDQDLKKSMGH